MKVKALNTLVRFLLTLMMLAIMYYVLLAMYPDQIMDYEYIIEIGRWKEVLAGLVVSIAFGMNLFEELEVFKVKTGGIR